MRITMLQRNCLICCKKRTLMRLLEARRRRSGRTSREREARRSVRYALEELKYAIGLQDYRPSYWSQFTPILMGTRLPHCFPVVYVETVSSLPRPPQSHVQAATNTFPIFQST